MSRGQRLIVVGLVLTGALLYACNMGNVLFWDDADWIVNNPCVHAPLSRLGCLAGHDVLFGIGQVSNYYRPFLMFTFAANWALGGAHPFGYHLVSNGLHIANAVLLFLLLARWLKDRRPAAVAAALWLMHPLQTEAVAYISGRGDPLSVFLMLIALMLWTRVDRWRWLAIVSAVLAVLSRETAVLFPLYLTLAGVVFEYRDAFRVALKRSLISVWPFYLVSLVYGVLRLTVLNFAHTLNWYPQANVYTEHVAIRIWTFAQVLWEYVRLFFIPTGLHMERNVPVLTTPWHFSALLGVVLVLAMAGWVIAAWRRGDRIPLFGVGMLLIPLGPSSGILAPINALIYEHWLYLSLVGITTLLAVQGVRWFDVLRVRARVFATVLLVLAIGYGLFLCVQTIRRNVIWGNPERLYLQILQYEPGNVRVLNNLANLYADQRNTEMAEQYWLRAISADPNQPAPYHNLGNLYRDQKDIDRASVWYHQAIQKNPTFWYAYQNLAAMLLENDRAGDAEPVLIRWQQANPSEPLTYYVLARMYAEAGEQAKARAMLEAGFPAAQAAGADIEAAFRQLASQL